MGLDEELLGEDWEKTRVWSGLSAMIEDFSASVELKRFQEFVLSLSWNILIRDCRVSIGFGVGF